MNDKLQALQQGYQDVIEKHLGSEFISGKCAPTERAEKIAIAAVSATNLTQKLVALAMLQRLEKAPQDPVQCEKFVEKMRVEMLRMLKNNVDQIVQQSMEEIAFVVFSRLDDDATEH